MFISYHCGGGGRWDSDNVLKTVGGSDTRVTVNTVVLILTR